MTIWKCEHLIETFFLQVKMSVDIFSSVKTHFDKIYTQLFSFWKKENMYFVLYSGHLLPICPSIHLIVCLSMCNFVIVY